jgi:hypothetical protein
MFSSERFRSPVSALPTFDDLFFCKSTFHGSCPFGLKVYHKPLIFGGLVFGDQVISAEASIRFHKKAKTLALQLEPALAAPFRLRCLPGRQSPAVLLLGKTVLDSIPDGSQVIGFLSGLIFLEKIQNWNPSRTRFARVSRGGSLG